ncbi:hypothetical protein EV421DRAFT_1284738 [Armillaria borealis]|uniref:Carrier domain-containing protein n=1 Tax=Armillaria borealis TaxID=47425 RepID=A0AA39J3P8_9AGAR|nr:hypothetical protein EV421DRAFT_1284738 [Armillaria borealis]
MSSPSTKASAKSASYDSTTWSSQEVLVRDVVADLCNVDPTLITKDLSFLHLGVDSIISIRLAQQLRAEGFAVPTFAIMCHPSSCIGELVNYANESSADMSVSAYVVNVFKEFQTHLRREYEPSVRLLAEDDIITAIFPATPLQTGMLTQTVASSGRLYMGDHVIVLHPSVSQTAQSLWTDYADIACLGVKHPLAVNVAVTANKAVVNVLGSSDLMASKQVKPLVDQFGAVLTVMLEALDRPLSNLNLDLKQNHLSVLKSIPIPTFSSSTGFEPIQWLSKRALTSPDEIAVSVYKAKKGAHSTWTFREIDEASNRVAHWICWGTTCPDVIALCMPQCHARFVYQFGIL